MDDLLSTFVDSFRKLDGLDFFPDLDPIAAALAAEEPDQDGIHRWQPRRSETDTSSLEMVYAKLPARFPPLFERFLLTYRWAEVDLETYKLLPNPPGPDLDGFSPWNEQRQGALGSPNPGRFYAVWSRSRH